MPHFDFNNSFVKLSSALYSHQNPTPVSNPSYIKFNTALAKQLKLKPEALQSDEGLAFFAGNAIPQGSEPIAMAYAGHQFGNWVPQLGDGRALLLGEVIDREGQRFDIQLKGAGPTPYSRNGDGRSALGPVVREYIISEAMSALGVPTTRALAAVRTGDDVRRENILPGAILTRVASSHIRVGSFQFFAARKDNESLKQLTDHVIARHYPEAQQSDNPALTLLKIVLEKQAALIAQWQSIGFIHGVMNTDNSSVAGITIDYGPCAFMDSYHPETVFSSIDHASRYAYKNQPGIAQWNVANLAQCLLPLINEDEEISLDIAQAVIDSFPEIYVEHYLNRFKSKLGLTGSENNDEDLIATLLQHMANAKTDFTNTFRALSHCSTTTTDDKDENLLELFGDQKNNISAWLITWRKRHGSETAEENERSMLMKNSNPAYIPRNHRVEQAIQAAENNDYAPIETLLTVLSNPFEEQAGFESYANVPSESEIVRATFCGT